MTISATIAWESGIAAGATADAEALAKMAVVAAKADAQLSVVAARGAEQRSAISAKSSAQLVAIQAKGAEQRTSIAAKAEAQLASIQAKGAIASVAQQNAAMARLITMQAKGAQDRARIAQQSESQLATVQAKAAADQEKIAAQHANRMAEIAAKGAQQQRKAAATADPNMFGQGPGAGPGMGDLLGRTGGKPGEVASMLAEQLGASSQAASLIGGAAGTAIRAVAFVGEKAYEAYQEAVAIITRLSSSGLSLALEATSARESIVGTFEALGRTEEQAGHLYERIAALAIKTNRDQSTIAAEFKRLSSAGFGDNQLEPIAKMLADVAGVKGDSKANQLEKILEKINAKGSLDARAITALNSQGFSQKDVYAQLAKVLGKKEADIPALIKQGKINSDKAVEAITTVIESKVSGVAEKQANTILALISRIKMAATEMFALDDATVAPVKTFLQNILATLTGPLGDHLKWSIQNLFSAAFGTAFDDLNSKAGKSMVADAFVQITNGVNMAASAVRQLKPDVEALLNLFHGMMSDGTIKNLVDATKGIAKAKLGGIQDDVTQMKWKAKVGGQSGGKTAWDMWTDPLSELDDATGAGVKRRLGVKHINPLKGLLDDIFESPEQMKDVGGGGRGKKSATNGFALPANDNAADAFSAMLPTVAGDDQAASMTEQGNAIGQALNQGVAQGVIDSAGDANSAVGAMAQQLIDTVRAITRTHSPSEEFADIGGDISAGVGVGVDRHANKATDAVGRMAGGAVATAGGFVAAGSQAGGGRSPGSGGGGGHTIQIKIEGGASAKAGGDEALAELVAERVLRKLVEAA